MAINGVLNSQAEAATNSVQLKNGSFRSSSNQPQILNNSTPAASVSLSDAEKNKKAGLESALRNLSPLQSFVDVSAKATERAEQVLNKALDLTKQIEEEVDPNKKASLASDAKAYLDELDTISATRTPSGVAITGQSSGTYTLTLEKPGTPPENTISVNLPSITLSKSDLGVSDLDEESLTTSNEESQNSIERALSTVSNVAAQLKSAGSAVSSVASAFGSDRAVKSEPNSEKAQELAEKISSVIKDAPNLGEIQNLDPARVLELLKDTEEDEELIKRTNSIDTDLPKTISTKETSISSGSTTTSLTS